MGKGDKKTRRGKLFGGSYGKLRPRKKKSEGLVQKPPVKKAVKPDEKPLIAKEAEETKGSEIKQETPVAEAPAKIESVKKSP